MLYSYKYNNKFVSINLFIYLSYNHLYIYLSIYLFIYKSLSIYEPNSIFLSFYLISLNITKRYKVSYKYNIKVISINSY